MQSFVTVILRVYFKVSFANVLQDKGVQYKRAAVAYLENINFINVFTQIPNRAFAVQLPLTLVYTF